MKLQVTDGKLCVAFLYLNVVALISFHCSEKKINFKNKFSSIPFFGLNRLSMKNMKSTNENKLELSV